MKGNISQLRQQIDIFANKKNEYLQQIKQIKEANLKNAKLKENEAVRKIEAQLKAKQSEMAETQKTIT